MSAVTTEMETDSSLLKLSSAAGPVYRRVKNTPVRDALPHEIPLIDISGIYSNNLSDHQAVAKKIHEAASTTGFFYIKNHGISPELTDAAYKSALAFFRQPKEVKESVDAKGTDGGLEGWKPPLSQQINSTESIDQRETFSARYSSLYDPLVDQSEPIPEDVKRFLSSSFDYLWENNGTKGLDGFQTNILKYWTSCLLLARKLLATVALGLGLPEDTFDEKIKFPDAVLALNYYPSLDLSSIAMDNKEKVSIGSHTDFQLLTILYQDQVGGLQILTSSGEWIKATPIPGTLVINIGDLLQRITNDRYVSTVHRAQNFSGKERISMPFFFGFGLNEEAEVLDCCVDEERPKKYGSVRCEEWVRLRAEGMYIQ